MAQRIAFDNGVQLKEELIMGRTQAVTSSEVARQSQSTSERTHRDHTEQKSQTPTSNNLVCSENNTSL